MPRLRRLLLACIAVPLVLFVAAAWYDRVRTLHAAETDTQRVVTALREHMVRALATDELLLREADRRVQGQSWDEIRAHAAALAADLHTMQVGLPEISNIALSDADGRLWVATVPQATDRVVSVAEREYHSAQQAADRGTFISGTFLGNFTNRSNFAISRRLSTPDGHFNGVIHIGIDTEYFVDFWAEAMRGQSGASVALVRLDGDILARYPHLAAAQPRLTAASSHLMVQLRDASADGVYTGTSTIDGTRRIVAFARLADYPLAMTCAVSLPVVLQPWWQDVLVLGLVCALAAAALVLAVLAVRRQMGRLAAEQGRRAALEQVAHDNQRLELLGQLAAGVAHDFGNVVQAVQGGAVLIERTTSQDNVRALARMLSEAAARGESLTRRMLDFARHDGDAERADESACHDAVEAVASACQLMARSLAPHCHLRGEGITAGRPVQVRGNRHELEAAVMNLVVNARDASPHGGEVVVRVERRSVTSLTAEDLPGGPPVGLPEGAYGVVRVIDHGVGMPPEVQARATEPFFTTKPRGKGTGLGLAGARGYAERAGGALRIESRVGEGTIVSLWLPVMQPGQAPSPGRTPAEGVGDLSQPEEPRPTDDVTASLPPAPPLADR